MTKEDIERELSEILFIMTIPSGRKELNDDNLKWMLRNLGIKNNVHPKFERAMICVRFLLACQKEAQK